MATAREAVAAVLAGDPVLAAVLTGGVWGQPINRQTTPGAFDGAQPGSPIKPCAAVADGGAQADRTGPPGATAGTVTVWVRATDSDAGRAAIETAAARIVLLLDEAVLPAEPPAVCEFAGTLEGAHDPFVAGARFRYVQFRGVQVW